MRGLRLYPAWYEGAVQIPFRNTSGFLLVDQEDGDYYAKLRPSYNGKHGAYFCYKRKKVYIHRDILDNVGINLLNRRVGFLDGLSNNCMKRNLFHYETGDKSVVAKREAWQEAAGRAKREGFVIYGSR